MGAAISMEGFTVIGERLQCSGFPGARLMLGCPLLNHKANTSEKISYELALLPDNVLSSLMCLSGTLHFTKLYLFLAAISLSK